MKMFEDMADEIFKQADVSKETNRALYDETVEILGKQMARLSATMGLSRERVEIFNEQKESLVKDLLEMKSAGEIS